MLPSWNCQAAAEAGKAAADRMKLIVLQGAEAAILPATAPAPDEGEWERLMEADDMTVEPSGFLREAFNTAQQAGHGSLPLGHVAGPPPGLAVGGPGMPAYNHASPAPVGSDPYLLSPSFGAAGFSGPVTGLPMQGANLTADVTPPRGTAALPRTPPPSTHGPTGHPVPAPEPPPPSGELPGYGRSPSLSDRVQRRRALEPFGSARPTDADAARSGTTGPGPTPNPEGPPIGPASFRILEDDDEDELDEAAGDENLS